MKKDKRSIADLLREIDFSPDNVVQAAAVNTVLFVESLDFRRAALEQKTAAKIALERAKAEMDVEARRIASSAQQKVTERQIESMITLDPEIQKLEEFCARADQNDEYMKLVVEAFRMRRDCLQIVGNLVRSEINAQAAYDAGSEQLSDMRAKLRKRFPGGK